ncbi:ribosome silencing factor [Capsulimonas corticalis]|uniref:ribosome silencing factor n=1 Tax=Capsulimonas corticalis TaxID=2219043 RepID=UPI001C3F7622|nr:ribosome silencing factor [Capsulimonas corticalis]
MKPSTLTSEQKRDIIVAAAEDKKANYMTEIDLRGKTLIADFFIICSGTSNIHIRSISDGVIESMEEHGIRAHRTEGYSEATWIVVDYGDVILHVMSEDERDRYKLEKLWTREVVADSTGATILPISAALPDDEHAGLTLDEDDEDTDEEDGDEDLDGDDEDDQAELTALDSDEEDHKDGARA